MTRHLTASGGKGKHRGFTLIEILVASVIAVLFISVLLGFYFYATGQLGRLAAMAGESPAAAVEQVADSLRRGALEAGQRISSFELRQAADGNSELSWVTVAGSAPWDSVWLCHVYQAQGRGLTMEQRSLTDPRKPGWTNILVSVSTGWQVLATSGKGWTNTWVYPDRGSWPEAIELKLWCRGNSQPVILRQALPLGSQVEIQRALDSTAVSQ